MHTVVQSREVYHLWAHARQARARNKTGTVSYEGDVAYSYRAPIARRVRNREGRVAFYFNTHRYCVTTSKHQSYCAFAIPWGETVFHFDFTRGETTADVVAQYRERIADLQARARRASIWRASLYQDAEAVLEEGTAFLRFWKLRGVILPAAERRALTAARIEAERTEDARIEQIRERERQRRPAAAEREAAFAAARQTWQEGGIWLSSLLSGDGMALLRIKDGWVETSRGARVSLAAARRLWARYQKGEPIHGQDIDGYTVISAGPEVIRIGCHVIPVAEAARVLGEGVPHAAA
ncbi:MAG TPA: hypothetical protein VFU47_09085 [Armatimonadota bacterium]|nr:hypothetical protein [Armatimonadota bacterium]